MKLWLSLEKNLSYAEKSLGDIHKSYLENYFR